LIGQETTGIGGFMKAMRTIPVMMNVAKTIENLAPDAWLINFSNPSGLLAEALLNHTNVKTIGLCNNPVNMIRDAKKRLPENTEIFDYDYVGLNHLSWMTAIYADGIEILQDQLKSNATVSTARNIPQIEYDDSLLQAAGGLPCAYLSYFYHRDKMLNKLKKAEFSRGEECKKIEQELLERYRDSTVLEKPVLLEKRGGSLYSEAAISLIDAMENDKNEIHVINTQNKGAFPFMEKEDVVECKCLVGKNGVMPVPFNGIVNEHIIGLMKTIKSYEKLAVTAGIQGDRNAALRAMLVHPLIGDYEKANAALDEMFKANREYLPQFFKVEEK
ncbi:MAG: 6-phospho-beta-glucosidase, partial [Lachnospiraceae bacterium]|nr:6-phospho-beta-glucosidase [Lachnospiraceae bacterium]